MNKHTRYFQEKKIGEDETIEVSFEGWIGDVMGSGDKTQHNGAIVLTNKRICFIRKGLLGEVFETIPISKITSVETRSRMGWRSLNVHTSHDNLEFKTFQEKADFESLYDALERLREGNHTPNKPAAAEGDPIELIKRLASLKELGAITDEEFEQKKAALLSQI